MPGGGAGGGGPGGGGASKYNEHVREEDEQIYFGSSDQNWILE